MKRGDRFKITRRSHWGYGRVFKAEGTPGLRLTGNPDSVPLVWLVGELVEFRATVRGQTSTFLIPVEWIEPIRRR